MSKNALVHLPSFCRQSEAANKDEAMVKRVCVINGHPHVDSGHLCHALSDAYVEGARDAGLEVTTVSVAQIQLECLLNPSDFEVASDSAGIRQAQEHIQSSDHLVIIFPLWLGTVPALLKAFLEQIARGGFLIGPTDKGSWPDQRMKGRSAHVIVTMGMPRLAYRLWFLNSGVSNLKRLVLGLSGIRPVRQTTIGGVGTLDERARKRWIERVREMGRRGR